MTGYNPPLLGFNCCVDGACAKCERTVTALCQSGFAHKLQHGVALWHCCDALGQITISASVF